jgi:hypothetical protein
MMGAVDHVTEIGLARSDAVVGTSGNPRRRADPTSSVPPSLKQTKNADAGGVPGLSAGARPAGAACDEPAAAERTPGFIRGALSEQARRRASLGEPGNAAGFGTARDGSARDAPGFTPASSTTTGLRQIDLSI